MLGELGRSIAEQFVTAGRTKVLIADSCVMQDTGQCKKGSCRSSVNTVNEVGRKWGS